MFLKTQHNSHFKILPGLSHFSTIRSVSLDGLVFKTFEFRPDQGYSCTNLHVRRCMFICACCNLVLLVRYGNV